MEWNVVATVQEGGYQKARKLLQRFGAVGETDFFNVLVLRVEDWRHLLEGLKEEGERDFEVAGTLASVIPVLQTFYFQTPQEFEEKAMSAATAFIPALAGKRFHVRMHRRGFKGKLSSLDEERFLDGCLLEALELAGTPGSIAFDDPDAVIAVETLGGRAGLSLWTRDDLRRFPLLHLK